MKKKYLVSAIAALVLVGGIVTYTVLGDYMGNNIEVESVMDRTETASKAGEGNSESDATSTAPVSVEEINGDWEIASGSKVYWSVTTSKETVNFVNEGVTGTWTLNVNDPAASTGGGIVDMSVLDSGNSQRDSHVKERTDLLQVAEFPEATFVTSSFSELPTEWTNGTAVPLTIEGTLTVKGIEKDVVFESEVMYQDGQLLLSGETIVTFADFGMQSPHAIVLEAENELTVQLELVLEKG